MAAFNQHSNKDEEELCPNCKKSFKRLFQHTPHCRGEKCPDCGLYFKRLASHIQHCKVTDNTESKTSEDEICPVCGLFFKRLASHIQHCKGKDQSMPKSTEGEVCEKPQRRPSKNNTDEPLAINNDFNGLSNNGEEELCPNCKKSFKRLSQHTPHCRGEKCPDCGLYFKRLASHIQHCKGTDNTESKTDEDEICPVCGLFFKRLASHIQHCKGKDQSMPKSTEGEVCEKPQRRPSKNNTDEPLAINNDFNGLSNNGEEELCPNCKKSFKRLSQHTPHCRGEKCPDCGLYFKRLASHIQHCKGTDNTESKTDEDEICPVCGLFFKRLASHIQHCKGKDQSMPKSTEGEVCEKPQRRPSKNNTDEPLAVNNDFNGLSNNGEEELCPNCKKSFKRLSQHTPHCRGEKCPDCGLFFKRLASHIQHCKGTDSTEAKTSEGEVCQSCGLFFKRLATHVQHCKGGGQPLPKTTEGKVCGNSQGRPSEKITDESLAVSNDLKHGEDEKQSGVRPKHECNWDQQSQAGEIQQLIQGILQLSESEIGQLKVACGDMFTANKCMPIIQDCDFCGEEFNDDTTHECDSKVESMEMELSSSGSTSSLDDVFKDVKLIMDDIRWGSTFINALGGQLKFFLNEAGGLFTWGVMPSGSYYEKLKVSKVDEFDVMLTTKIGIAAPVFSDQHPGYCSLEVQDTEKYKNFLTQGKWLSPKAIKSHLEVKIPEALDQLRTRQWKSCKKIQSTKSPAITLRVEVKTYIREELGTRICDVDLVPAIKIPWPEEIVRRLKQSEWLDKVKKKKIMNAPVYVVPKPADSELTAKQNTDKLWRISFSAAEKVLLLHADGAAVKKKEADGITARKLVHKAMKLILEKAKEEAVAEHNLPLKKITSYHVKTLMLWQFEEHPDNTSWVKLEKLRHRLNLAIKQFIRTLRKKNLPHYFIRSPPINLLTDVPDDQIEVLCSILQKCHDRF